MIPLKMWERSRGLVLVALLVTLAMVVTFIGATLRPGSTFAAMAPQFIWGGSGVLIGLFVATDVLTRAERPSGDSRKNH